jgi:hypothetical protein
LFSGCILKEEWLLMMRNKIDSELLREEIRTMQRWSPLYKLLKEELSLRGFWKNRKRGNPIKGYEKGMGKPTIDN